VYIDSRDSPFGAKALQADIIGPTNAGKSSVMNWIVGKSVTAVSGKSHTTKDGVIGIYTEEREKVQVVFNDTAGSHKENKSYRSTLLRTSGWKSLTDADLAIFVVDAVKRIDFTTRYTINRLVSMQRDPRSEKIKEAVLNNTFSEEALK